jgi:glycosyltransferase involved in cell wall biosynthesis
MKVLIVSSNTKSLVNFRGSLILKIKSLGHEVCTLSPEIDSTSKETLIKMGVITYEYNLDRTGFNLLNDLNTFFDLVRHIKNIKPDLVFSYTVKPVIYGSLAAKYCKVPKIFSMITGLGSGFSDDLKISRKVIKHIIILLYKISCSRINGLIFQNDDDRLYFISKKIINENLTYQINGSGVDLNLYKFHSPQIFPIRFIFIGRLLVEKGLLDFISASKMIKIKYPEVIFDILGPFDINKDNLSQSDFIKYINAAGVNYLGETSDVRSFIKSSSVYIMPSYYREGVPRTTLECLAMGRPVITTDMPGCKETVINNLNGFLVPIKDPLAIVRAMEKFICNNNLITEMGIQSRNIAVNKFDVEIINKKMVEILNL